MPTVAPPVATASLLTGFASEAGASSAGTTDLLAGLFQSVLAQSVLAQVVSHTAGTTVAGQLQAVLGGGTESTATPTAPASAAGSEATTTDVLAELLALTDKDTADTTVSPDLLSQLLAALGVNGQTLAQLQQADTTTAGTDATQLLAATARAATGLATAALSPAVQQVLDRSGLTARLLPNPTATVAGSAGPTGPGTNARSGTESTPPSAPAEVVPSPPPVTVAPPVVTVTEAVRTGGRIPAVVLQTPVSTDSARQLPPSASPVEPDSVQPPVGEVPRVTAPPVVSPGQPLVGLQRPDIELPIPGTAIPSPVAPTASFALPATTDLTITTARTAPTPAAAPLDPVVTPTRTPVTSPATPPAEPTRTPVAAPAPGIAITVAQPLSVSGAALGLSDWVGQVGLTQPIGPPVGLQEKVRTGDSDASGVVGVPAAPQRSEPAPTPADATAATANPAPSVAEQLNVPIVAHLQAQPADGETELRIRLDPPELGSVKLKIVSTGGEVRAELHVSSDAVRRVVEGQLPELWQKLDDAGVRVQRMDVTSDSAGNSNAGTARDDRGGRWEGPTPPEPVPLVPARPGRLSAVPASARTRIDLTA